MNTFVLRFNNSFLNSDVYTIALLTFGNSNLVIKGSFMVFHFYFSHSSKLGYITEEETEELGH